MAELPSFSIVLETENLENADIEDLTRSLRSLVEQDVGPDRANEVLLIDSGDAPPELLRQLCDRYPWIKVHSAAAATGYYQAKMLGAKLATGEVVIYCDSDCIYEPGWLRYLLTPFLEDAEIHVVAGETRTRGRGPYGTAMALTYIFPQYSGRSHRFPVSQYFLNNVAFRRTFLLQHPIPPELPLYRGNCVIHAQKLTQAGHTIWRQPIARSTHAPPEGLSHFFWRFLLIGHDYYWQNQLMQGDRAAFQESSFRGKVQTFFDRVGKLFADDPRHWLYLPLAVPIAAASIGLILAGYLITRWRPHHLLQAYDRRQHKRST